MKKLMLSVLVLLLLIFNVIPAAEKIGELYDEAIKAYESKDYPKAFGIFKRITDAVDMPDAQYSLGIMHENGFGTPKDQKQAFQCFRKACELGVTEQQFNTGAFCDLGQCNIQDAKKAFNWYKRASNQNQALAIEKLIVCYREGKGTRPDPDKAAYWIDKLEKLKSKKKS